MAARKTPSGGSKPDKFLRDALIIELNRQSKDGKTKRYNKIAAMLADAGEDGKMDAIKEIWDRVEGKPAQAVTLGNTDDSKPFIIKWES